MKLDQSEVKLQIQFQRNGSAIFAGNVEMGLPIGAKPILNEKAGYFYLYVEQLLDVDQS